jgi:hypothetical protein
MASMQSVIYKIEHAQKHFEELKVEVDKVYALYQGKSVTTRDVSPTLGLIFGDCIQNLRSSLDYLINELVEANGGKPNRKHMFPVALTRDQYERDVTQKLNGIHPKAAIYIDALQPYLLSDPKNSPLYVLDELTNHGKHRRPIVTLLTSSDVEPPFPMPHMRALGHFPVPGTETLKKVPLWLWVGVGEEPVKGGEVITVLNSLAAFIGNEVFPLFKQFLT